MMMGCGTVVGEGVNVCGIRLGLGVDVRAGGEFVAVVLGMTVSVHVVLGSRVDVGDEVVGKEDASVAWIIDG